MRHQKSGRKLGMTSSHRKAMFRNMVTSLFEHGKVTTTETRAKELRRLADRLVTLGKKNTVHAKRLAARTIRTREVLVKLFDEIAPGFVERAGGYTRIVKLNRRLGDNAPMTIIELMPPGPPATKGRPSLAPLKPSAVPVTKEQFGGDAE
ncbi:MAG: 50S ribosomal protein L17 [Deltaproteobacteria bacterium]|nr:MAG: 50S ribosomal protein L17 [Deltaproteobacteria bacterium]